MGSIQIRLDSLTTQRPMPVALAWLPYVLLAVLLVLSRAIAPVKAFFLSVLNFSWKDILGEQGVSGGIELLYLPGGVMALVVILTFFLHRMSFGQLKAAVSESSRTLFGAGFVLIFTVPMVRILINSGVNAADLPSMPIAMAQLVSDTFGSIYPFFAPVVGALGAFIAGSNTVSNLMLALFQFTPVALLGASTLSLRAVQAVGAAAGNMIEIGRAHV